MTRFIFLILFLCPLILSGQIRLSKLVLKYKEKYELKGDILVLDTLIMMDSSTLLLNKLKSDNFIHAKVVYFNPGCLIDGKGVHGIPGRSGKPGVTSQSPCTNGGTGNPGTDGTPGGSGTNLFFYVSNIFFKGVITLDVSGGDAGDGGVGGGGGGGGRGVVPCAGGNGGQGGTGGQGGNGGLAGNVAFVSPRILEIRSALGSNMIVRNYGGNLGLGGLGGALGFAGLSALGNPKMDGKPGRKGIRGKDGDPGKFRINKFSREIMNRRWLYKPIPDKESIEALSKAINVNDYLCAILLQRGINSYAEARKFFRPSLDDLHDPYLMKDMDKAVDRMKTAIDKGEKILIYGDYDVDGTTAVSLVYSYISSIYPHCDFYIPDRSSEGYGVSQKGILWAAENNFSLIIALDLGIKASDMVVLANHKGIDFIICDHHLPDKKIPQAVAVLDPKQEDCNYPFTELSGCGIGFKLLQAFTRKHGDEKNIFDYLDLVAVSIASDIVPISGENRILAHYGLRKLNENPRPGLKALKEIALVKSDLDIAGVVFTLGPRINAAGRVAHARGAVELLNAKTEEEANAFAEKINVKNDLRREFDLNITEEALAMIGADETLVKAKSTVLFKDSWHKGVIGIVAARCIERYYRPTVILTESNDKITGSARSVNGFDLYQAIEQCSDLLEKFGGHKYAAGLTLDPINLPAFQRRFEEVVAATITDEMLTPVVEIDHSIRFDVITPKFIGILKQMAPFGPENHKPVFESQNVFVMNSLATFKDRHLRFLAGQRGSDNFFNAVGFDQIEYYDRLLAGDAFRMAFTIEENVYNGNTGIQLRIKDIKFD